MPSRKNIHSEKLNPDILRQVFMKGPRLSNQFGALAKDKFVFLEKSNLGQLGVVFRRIRFENGEKVLRITDTERTIIDCVVAPHYSGGLPMVTDSIRRAKIEIPRLLNYYQAQDFLYPYWQTIGFLLEITQGENIARQWRSAFSDPVVDFYVDRNFRTDWKYSPTWKVYFPGGMLSYGS
jgi:hypothetical protein